MKPIYLEFCGINSFSEKTQIDFRSLLAGGVFGIFGDTGSGKSTILDCIHLALYGVVERASKSMSDCINYNADSAYVVFDFEITTNGVRKAYRVRRERKRKNNTSKAFLYEYTENGEMLALAEGSRDVDDAVEKIIGLNFNDFKMCIALPQGDFAALVKAATAERVKLVSRLFDLEKYGEKLSKAVNEKYYNAEQEVNLIKAEMGQNEGGRDEFIVQKQQEIANEKALLSQTEEQLLTAEKHLEKVALLAKEQEEYKALILQLAEWKARLPEMEEKRREAERFPQAKRIDDKAKELQQNEKAKAEAAQSESIARVRQAEAEETLKQAKDKLLNGGFDEKIVQILMQLEKVQGAQADIAEAERIKKRLDECIEQYNLLKKKCVQEDFEGEKQKLESELSSLGEDDSLLEYLKHHFKDALLAEEYEQIRSDLHILAEKYPQAQEDIRLLMKKYTSVGVYGQEIDVVKLHAEFKQIEQRRKTLKGELEKLEKRRADFDANEKQKQLWIEQGKIYRKAYEEASEKIAFIKDLGTVNEIEARLKEAQNAKQSAQARAEEIDKKVQQLHTEAEKQKSLYELHLKLETSLQTALAQCLQEGGFESVESARALIARLGNEEQVKKECKTFFDKYEVLKAKYEETDEKKFFGFDETALSQAKEQKRILQAQKDEINRRIAAYETELKHLQALRERYKAFEKELTAKEKQRDLCDELRSLLRNNRFLEFIAAEYLQEICLSASKTLLQLTGGRYFLKYEKEFKVGDNLDGGNLRAVKTLSGGETFLVSLSLALSLSGAICQKSLRPIEFFFLDEGFGTLDERLVDTVMDVLGKLSKNFAVGLISHVEELKHRIDNKILVTGATEQHGSKVQLVHF